MILVSVQSGSFSLDQALDPLERLGGGAIASFVGLVRGHPGDTLTLEHYPGMTENALRRLGEEAVARWSLLGVSIIHRVGRLMAGERIVLAATCAPHRRASFESCAFLIDRLKTNAPFWKSESVGGEQSWVETRETDDVAAARWTALEPKR